MCPFFVFLSLRMPGLEKKSLVKITSPVYNCRNRPCKQHLYTARQRVCPLVSGNTKPNNQLHQRTNAPTYNVQCVVYKVGCVDCNFVYYEQTDRALELRLKEYKRAVRVGDNNSKVAQHANLFVHSVDFDHATIVDRARNFHERLNVVSNVNKSQCQAQILTLMSIPDCSFSIFSSINISSVYILLTQTM